MTRRTTTTTRITISRITVVELNAPVSTPNTGRTVLAKVPIGAKGSSRGDRGQRAGPDEGCRRVAGGVQRDRPPGRSWLVSGLRRLGDEVFGLGMVADDGVGGLLGVQLETLGHGHPDAVGAEELDHLGVVLEVGARRVAPRVPPAPVLLF